MTAFRLLGKIVWTYRITVKTGLHIGASASLYDIGAPDHPVIKHPDTNEPYVPGSSMKGKLRSLLEKRYVDWSEVQNFHAAERELSKDERKAFEEKGFTVVKTGGTTIFQLGDCKKYIASHNISDEEKEAIEAICKLFGMAGDKTAEPSRLIITDALLSKKGGDKRIVTELKGENALDRVTSAANPRVIERVPPGTTFEGHIIMNVYQPDDVKYLRYLREALELLVRDYLGGHGTRGYGRVQITIEGPEYYPEDLKNKINTAEVERLCGNYNIE